MLIYVCSFVQYRLSGPSLSRALILHLSSSNLQAISQQSVSSQCAISQLLVIQLVIIPSEPKILPSC